MNHKLCCIGYITRDKIVTPDNTVYMPGGTAFYFAKAISRLQAQDFLLVSALAEEDKAAAEEIIREGIEVKLVPTAHSHSFENIYGHNPNERRQRVTAQADSFRIDDLRDVQANIIHLGTLLADDFSLEVIKYLASRSTLAADVQGFLRKVENEKVFPVDWAEKREALKYIHTLKANESEMEVLTGCDEPHEAALLIADWGVKTVLLTLGDKGSVVDATGCGDTYMAGYLYKRSQGASHQEAGCFAAAMCTLKLQAHGPFNGTEAMVNSIIGK